MQALAHKSDNCKLITNSLKCKLAVAPTCSYKNKSVPPLNRMNAMRNIFEKVKILKYFIYLIMIESSFIN